MAFITILLGLKWFLMCRNIKRWWDEQRLKKKFSENEPTEMEKKWLNEAKPKIIKPSLLACNSLLSGKRMMMSINYQDLALNTKVRVNLPCEFIKDSLPGIGFVLRSDRSLNARGVYYKESFELDKSLEISTESGRKLFTREDSVSDFKNDFPATPNRLKGRLKNIGTVPYYKIKSVFIRQIIQLKDTDITYPTTIVKEKAFLKFEDSSWNRRITLLGIRAMSKKEQYCEVKIDDNTYDFYIVESAQSQIIDSNQPTTLEIFKQRSNAIRSAFAILSGKYYRTNVFYVTSKKEDFSKLEDVYYEMEEPSWHGEFQLIDLQLFSKYYEDQNEEAQASLQEYHKLFPAEIFSKLCQEISNNEEIGRVADLILSGNANLSAIQQGAIYSVAIETFANEIYKTNEVKLKPVKDKPTFDALRDELLKIIDGVAEKIGENAANIFRNKITDLNNPTNRDRLFKPFELYGIELTQSEIDSLNNRNQFLHGRLPNEDEWKVKKIALDLHFLLCCLLLKYVGYSGHINNPAIHFVVKNIAPDGDYLPKFDSSKVMSMEKIEEMRNHGRIEEAKDVLSNTINALKAYEMLMEVEGNFIKII